MTKLNRKVATAVYNNGDYTIVEYHRTEVVKFNRDEIVLNSRGWRTKTTKARMNQASNQFNLGFKVFQEKKVWYVDFNGDTLEFYDGITLVI